MVWWKKDSKEERLPELPDLPELPSLMGKTMGNEISSKQIPEAPMKKADLPSIPSFPSSPTGDKFGYEAVKRAVKHEEEFEMPEIPEDKIPKTKEIEEFEMPMPTMQRTVQSTREMKSEPIYVRIDKYQESLSSFNEVKKRLLEVENLLRDIKEIRQKEETELQGWIGEIQQAKSKLDEIDKTVFQKLEE